MQRLIQYFGKGIANVINIVDPDVIVIGGGLGQIDELYTDGVAEASKLVFNPRVETIFVKPKLGDSAGVFGAVLLRSPDSVVVAARFIEKLGFCIALFEDNLRRAIPIFFVELIFEPGHCRMSFRRRAWSRSRCPAPSPCIKKT